jgi:hypothetical protein
MFCTHTKPQIKKYPWNLLATWLQKYEITAVGIFIKASSELYRLTTFNVKVKGLHYCPIFGMDWPQNWFQYSTE